MKIAINLGIRTLTLFVLFIYSIFTIYFFVTNDMWVNYKDCGVVVGASSEDRPIKHGVQTDLYLLIEFEKDGFKAQEVSPTTYFKYKDKIGQKLCFEQTERNPIMEKNSNLINFILGGVSLVLYFLFLAFIFIDKIFDEGK